MFKTIYAQKYMQENNIDAWLIYDYHNSNFIKKEIVKSSTKRSFILIPKEDNLKILANILDKKEFSEENFLIEYYAGWKDLHSKLKFFLKGCKKIAVEYSPYNSIPSISIMDAGTFELLKSFDIEIVSSANLVQVATCLWDEDLLKSHLRTAKHISQIKDAVFNYIAANIPLTEYDIQEFILQEFEKRNLTCFDMRPIIAVNENSNQPHYQPNPNNCSSINNGDWILVDFWAREKEGEKPFVDVTYVGYVGQKIHEKYQNIFDIVKKAQDIVIDRLNEAYQKNEVLQSWELDFLARQYITKSGYGDYFPHTTGHSLGIENSPHGIGIRLDSFETQDIREIMPKTAFTIEPGIYIKEFGVRLEIDVYIDETKKPIITTPYQNEIIKIGE